jgi:hypothetical protein
MAAYPSYPILLGSTQKPEKGWRDTTASSGSLHSRQLHGKNYFQFSLLHSMTKAEFRALSDLYDAGPRTVHTLTYLSESPIVTYSVTFTAPPEITSNVGGDHHMVRSTLRGFKD